MRGLDTKAAIVTGGATIIGAAVVRAFQAAGTRVVLADVDEEGGRRVADEFGDEVRFVRTDVRSDDDIAACVREAVDAYGGLDIVVNLACVYVDDGLESTRDDWLTSYDVNLVGAVMLVKEARPHLAANGGVVVNFGSISAKVAQTGRWLYPASKAAMVQVTRSMAMDLVGEGIRVNSVSPGWTWSQIMNQLSGGDRAHTDQVAAPFHLLGRVGDPEEVAAGVLFLCSDDASFITGADLPVDGGYTAMGPEQAEPAIPKLEK